MKITIDTKKFNEALHHITSAISLLQGIRDEFLDSIEEKDNGDNNSKEEEKKNNA